MAKKKKQPKYTLSLPIISRVNSKTIGLDLVSVQPMRTPKGKFFYFDWINDKERLKAKLDTLITGEIPEKYRKDNEWKHLI